MQVELAILSDAFECMERLSVAQRPKNAQPNVGRRKHASGQIFVMIRVVRISFQIFSRNQILNALLDLFWVGLEVSHELCGGLQHELLVVQTLASLHDANL